MTTYHIAARPRLSPGKRVLNQLARTGFFLLLYTAVWRVAEGRWLHLTLLAILGAVPFLWNLLTTVLWEKQTSTYDAAIEDNRIRLSCNRKVARTVPSNRR